MRKFESVVLPNGQSAVLMIPTNDNQKLAVVDLQVLKALAELLPKANVEEIRDDFMHTISKASNLNQMVEAAKEFVAFHESVNIIREYKVEEKQDKLVLNH